MKKNSENFNVSKKSPFFVAVLHQLSDNNVYLFHYLPQATERNLITPNSYIEKKRTFMIFLHDFLSSQSC